MTMPIVPPIYSSPIPPVVYYDTQRVLEAKQVGTTMQSTMEWTTYQNSSDYLMNYLNHKLTAFVFTEKLAPAHGAMSIEVPDGWFQTLKRDWMRDWVIKRWPVKTRWETQTVQIMREAMYPEANLAYNPSLGRTIIFESIPRLR